MTERTTFSHPRRAWGELDKGGGGGAIRGKREVLKKGKRKEKGQELLSRRC